MNEETKKENKKGILGAKKIAIIVATIIGIIVIGGVSIVALTQKDNKPEKTVAEKKEGTKVEQNVKEEVPAELQQWQKDYTRVLLELLYLPVTEMSRSEGWDELYETKVNLDWLFICASEETVYFGLMDVNEDGTPELFVKTVCNETNNRYYMFTTGNSTEECYVSRVNYVDANTNEIIRLCGSGVGPRYIAVYTLDENGLKEKLVFGYDEDTLDQQTIYGYYTRNQHSYEMSEQITKEKYDELSAQYSKEDQFLLDTHELSLENIESRIGVQIPNKNISLYQHCNAVYKEFDNWRRNAYTYGYVYDYPLLYDEVYFNNDDEPDYILTYEEYHVLLVSGENQYYRIDGLDTGHHSSSYTYIEKTGKMLRFATGSGGIGYGQEIYQLNDRYELDYIGYFGEDCERDMYGQPIMNPATGECDFFNEYHIEGIDEELSDEEWQEKIDALLPGEELDLRGTRPIGGIFSNINIIAQPVNKTTQSQDKTTLEKATHFTTASASSTLPDEGKYNYNPTNVLTKDASCWVEGASGYGEGEWIKFELPEKQLLSGLKIINGYAAGTLKQYTHNSKITEVLIEFSNGDSITTTLEVFDDANKNTVQKIKFDKPVETSYVKITIKGAKAGECQDTCLTYVAPF